MAPLKGFAVRSFGGAVAGNLLPLQPGCTVVLTAACAASWRPLLAAPVSIVQPLACRYRHSTTMVGFGIATCRRFSSSASTGGFDEDPYKVLNIDRTASADEIKAAYRKQALEWHPDRQPPEKRKEAERRFAAAANAYEILSDPERKQQYNTFGHDGARTTGSGFPSGSPGHGSQQDAERLFRQVFGDFGHKSMNELLSQLLGGQASSSRAVHEGMEVEVLSDLSSVLKACRSSGIDSTNDHIRRRSLGRRGVIRKVDTHDKSVKVSVKGVGDVWFGVGAVRTLGDSPIGGGTFSDTLFGSSSFGGSSFGGVGGSTAEMRQEYITRPDGSRFLRITRMIRTPSGTVREEVQEVPLN